MVTRHTTKDIAKYKQKFFGNMTKRQFKACVIIIVLVIAFIYYARANSINIIDYKVFVPAFIIIAAIYMFGSGDIIAESLGLVISVEKYPKNLFKKKLVFENKNAKTKAVTMLSEKYIKPDYKKIESKKYLSLHPDDKLY